jgi:hypothetical protein
MGGVYTVTVGGIEEAERVLVRPTFVPRDLPRSRRDLDDTCPFLRETFAPEQDAVRVQAR